jgi:hypothetical protein
VVAASVSADSGLAVTVAIEVLFGLLRRGHAPVKDGVLDVIRPFSRTVGARGPRVRGGDTGALPVSPSSGSDRSSTVHVAFE